MNSWRYNMESFVTKHTMKTYGGVELQLIVFLTCSLCGGERSDSRPDRFAPEEIATNTNWTEGWMNPRACLDAVVGRKMSAAVQNRILLLRSSSSLSAYYAGLYKQMNGRAPQFEKHCYIDHRVVSVCSQVDSLQEPPPHSLITADNVSSFFISLWSRPCVELILINLRRYLRSLTVSAASQDAWLLPSGLCAT
jgi:hypothetical protein